MARSESATNAPRARGGATAIHAITGKSVCNYTNDSLAGRFGTLAADVVGVALEAEVA